MSGIFPLPATSGGSPPPSGDDHLRTVDPAGERETERDRWEVRGAALRAVAIAEEVFGGTVHYRRIGGGLGGLFRGLVELEIPFADLDRHLEREARFRAAVGRDEVTAAVPLVFTLAPRPVEGVEVPS